MTAELPADLRAAVRRNWHKRQHLLVALDFDGTMAPIVDRAEDARPLPRVRRSPGRPGRLGKYDDGTGVGARPGQFACGRRPAGGDTAGGQPRGGSLAGSWLS